MEEAALALAGSHCKLRQLERLRWDLLGTLIWIFFISSAAPQSFCVNRSVGTKWGPRRIIIIWIFRILKKDVNCGRFLKRSVQRIASCVASIRWVEDFFKVGQWKRVLVVAFTLRHDTHWENFPGLLLILFPDYAVGIWGSYQEFKWSVQLFQCQVVRFVSCRNWIQSAIAILASNMCPICKKYWKLLVNAKIDTMKFNQFQ